MSWTAGEPVVGLMTAGGNQLGNGYYPAMDLQALSIQDKSMDVQIKLYPNPVLSVLNIDNNLTNQPYDIIDTLGKVILKGNLNQGHNSINVEQLSKGVYYLKVADKNASKFIKE